MSAYASTHSWEDWAETWAHYLHIVDTVEMAAAFGIRVQPRVTRDETMAAEIDLDPYQAGSMQEIIDAWLPLTFAVNNLNRAMGSADLYPFVLSSHVVAKLGFVHRVIGRYRCRPSRYPAPGRSMTNSTATCRRDRGGTPVVRKRSPNPFYALPMSMTRLTMASWETVMRRAAMMAQGTCTVAEYQRMAAEKVTAMQMSATAFMLGRGHAAVLAPFVNRARANARRLRRQDVATPSQRISGAGRQRDRCLEKPYPVFCP